MAEFLGNNSLGARRIMLERSVYDAYSLTLLPTVDSPTLETMKIKDFQKNERMMYGRVNVRHHPVFPLSTYLAPIAEGAGMGDNIPVAVNFVSDAFQSMKREFDKAIQDGRISKSSPVLNQMRVVESYKSPLEQYNDYIKGTKEDLKKFAKKKGRLQRIRNFETFVPVFMEYVNLTGRELPITRSMFFLTKYVSPLTSGLVLEVHGGSYGDDRQKVDAFYRQKNFQYFKNLAFSRGFMVDKHITWRLVADLNSPQMDVFIKGRFGGARPNAAQLMTTVFKKTYSDDIPSIIRLMVEVYNTLTSHRSRTVIRETKPTISQYTGKQSNFGCRTVKTVVRKPTTIQEVTLKYPSGFWLSLYARIRNIETDLRYNPHTLEEIIKRSKDLADSLDRLTGLRYIVSKFDNLEHFEGSMFYDITRLEMAKAGAEEEDVAETVRRSVQASNFVVY